MCLRFLSFVFLNRGCAEMAFLQRWFGGDGEWSSKKIGYTAAAAVAVGGVTWIALRYRVAGPNQKIIMTGLGITDIRACKTGVQWPFQTAHVIGLEPKNYTFILPAMSKEMINFTLPGVFTIGPEDTTEATIKYAKFLASDGSKDGIIQGVIEGETRDIAANLDILEIFNGREAFRKRMMDTVQEELKKFGLTIYNANIKELEDAPNSKYFENMRQRKLADVENKARTDIAEAKYRGDVGVKEKQRDTRIQTVQYEAQAIEVENTRNMEMAKTTSAMNVQKAEYERQAAIAQIEAKKAAQIRDSELQKDLEVKKIAQETERQRSELLSKTIVEAEAKERQADANLYQTRREAEGILYRAQNEADGIRAKYEAQADGLQRLLNTSKDSSTVLSWMMIERDIFPQLAEANAKAIQGLQPKITNWTTTSDGSGNNSITDILKLLPPLFTTIQDQTGIKPPNWMITMPESTAPTPTPSTPTPKTEIIRPTFNDRAGYPNGVRRRQ